jgi:hypothetical protein
VSDSNPAPPLDGSGEIPQAQLDLIRETGDTEEHFTAGLAIMIALSKEKAMRKRSSVAVILICGFTALSLAQTPPESPKPGPEHKKLEYFLGTWKTEGEIKANEYLPAGKLVTTEIYTLGPGGFFVVFDRPEGQIPRTQGIMAYDSHAKVYTSFYANGAGLVGTGTGTVNGDTWTFMVEDKVSGMAVKGRTTITIKSATQFTSKYEMADTNGRYTTILEGTSTKVAP